MENPIVSTLQLKVATWKEGGYQGVEKETKNILSHIQKVGFLHQPQVEAFETYVYIKEILGNPVFTDLVRKIFDDERELVKALGLPPAQVAELAWDPKKEEKISQLILEKFNGIDYPNYIFALTMGAGKTILMGVMIAYDFVLSYYHPDDKRFAKNALVFAPDTTIIESLKEIKTFDYSQVIPKEYFPVLLNIKYHYLQSTDTPLNPIGNYNIIVSNSQKIILKTQHKQGNNLSLFDSEKDLKNKSIENKRLQAIRSLSDLSIFVDEAHHSFGTTLEGMLKKTRETINYIHTDGKTPLVSSINLTGTPYIKNKMIPHTVFYFGLKQGIEKGILKQIRFRRYANVQTEAFIKNVLDFFCDNYGENRLEGKLPKIAFYAPSIDSLRNELKPTIQSVLAQKGISLDKILEYHTEAEENHDEFLNLDTEGSNKQFILLVGKGTEGWNCRSLISTALYRKPKSAIFVLQSSTRCLRSIGENVLPATIFLSEDNARILDKELKNNFSTNIEELSSQEQEAVEHTLVVEKTKKVKVKKVLKQILSVAPKHPEDVKIELTKFKPDKYQPYLITRNIVLNPNNKAEYLNDMVVEKIQSPKAFTYYEIIEILNRQTHIPCLEITTILDNNGLDKTALVEKINNQPTFLNYLTECLLSSVFEYKEDTQIIEEELELTKRYPFKISVNDRLNKLVIYKQNENGGRLGFHINPYNFDSKDEKDIFLQLKDVLEKDETITDIFFTGGVTDPSHSDFFFNYYNPETKRMAKYFPDFLIETSFGRYLVVEVKQGDKKISYDQNKEQYSDTQVIFDEVFAKELGFEEFQKVNPNFAYHIIFDAELHSAQKALFDTISQTTTANKVATK